MVGDPIGDDWTSIMVEEFDTFCIVDYNVISPWLHLLCTHHAIAIAAAPTPSPWSSPKFQERDIKHDPTFFLSFKMEQTSKSFISIQFNGQWYYSNLHTFCIVDYCYPWLHLLGTHHALLLLLQPSPWSSPWFQERDKHDPTLLQTSKSFNSIQWTVLLFQPPIVC